MWPFRTAIDDPSLTCQVIGGGSPDVVVRLGGSLSGDVRSRRLERSVEEQTALPRVRRIHVDLRNLASIDLEGVGVLARAYRESERHGRSLTVERASGPVRRRLLTTGILRIMSPPDSAASAS